VSSETREFLARAFAWPQEADAAPSFVNVHHVIKLVDKETGAPLMGSNGKRRVAVPGRACRNLDEAARFIAWAASTKTDVYMCMSSQRSADETISKRGYKYFKAIRRQDNIARHKGFYIDVDVKPDDLAHGYASTEEAINEFARIRGELGLPRQSFAVGSGSGGFHAHWCLTEPIGTDEWLPLSAALCAGFLAKGFRGDTACIVDSVRLLRPPGTFNYKRPEAPSPVTFWGNTGHDHFLESLKDVLAPYIGMMRSPSRPAHGLNGHGTVNGHGPLGPVAKAFAGVQMPALDAGLDVLKPTIEAVARSCPFILRSLATGGADNDNALRLQTMNVALFVQDSRATAHRMANKRHTCTPEETDDLYVRQEASRRTRDMGWPRCVTIASYGAPECVACPLRQHDRSPLNYAQAAAAAQVQNLQTQGVAAVTTSPIQVNMAGTGLAGNVQPATTLAPLPSPYAYDQLSRVCREEVDDKGNQTYTPLCSFTMEKPWLQQTPPSLNFTTTTSQGIQAQIRLPFEVINDAAAFKRTLGKQGMMPFKHEIDDLGDFYVSWIGTLRADRTNVIQNQSFGWAVKGGKLDGFVYGGYLWSNAVPRPASNTDPVLASQYLPIGDLQPWIDAAKLITNQQRPALDAILASAFAAPLVRFTGQSGVLLSTYSTLSGIGKSTALKIAQAVWGSPVKAVQSLSDTQNSVLKKMGDTRNLPLFWDELKTKEDTQRFANLAFQLSLGKEKSRLGADTSYREPGTWQTLLCSTSNDSILAHILSETKTTLAGLYRVFEFEVPAGVRGQIETTQAALIVAALNDNFGQAGLLYSQFLGAQHARIAKDIEDYSRALEAHFKVQSDERFWLALMTTVIMGAAYANEIGLTSIDVNALKSFMADKFQRMRNERTLSTVDLSLDINVLGVLARYLNEHKQSHTLVTSTMWRGAGRPPLGAVQLVNTDMTRIRSLRIHQAIDDRLVRLIKQPWDDWLAEKGLTPSLINKGLAEKFGVHPMRGRLGVGTALLTSSEGCIEINYGDPVFKGLLDL
jgi:hypothetical protein